MTFADIQVDLVMSFHILCCEVGLRKVEVTCLGQGESARVGQGKHERESVCNIYDYFYKCCYFYVYLFMIKVRNIDNGKNDDR